MVELIFVVEGETGSGRLARQSLEKAGYAVHTLPASAVLEQAQKSRPALLVLSPDVPGLDGSTLKKIRQHSWLGDIPILLLVSHADSREDPAFQLGAAAKLRMPFDAAELVECVQGILRRTMRPYPVPACDVDPVDIVIDRAAMKVLVRGNEVPTTTLEFRLVDYLACHRGHVLTRDLLLDAVWGETQFVTPRSVDACIRRVREKIEPDRASPTYLKTIRGVGYRFDAFAAWPDWRDRCNCAACTAPAGAAPKRRRTAT
jgi:DNA-binding response OmpR family regulator